MTPFARFETLNARRKPTRPWWHRLGPSACGLVALASPWTLAAAPEADGAGRLADTLGTLREGLAKELPTIDDAATKRLLEVHAAEAAASREASHEPLDRARMATLEASRDVLAGVDDFLADPSRDGRLVLGALLAQAPPGKLGEFAARGPGEAEQLRALLGDLPRMRDMLVAGGAKQGNWAEALRIHEAIRRASPRCRDGVFARLALGTALEHAVPVPAFGLGTPIDPVRRYLAYEKAWLDGRVAPRAGSDPAAFHPRCVLWWCVDPDAVRGVGGSVSRGPSVGLAWGWVAVFAQASTSVAIPCRC